MWTDRKPNQAGLTSARDGATLCISGCLVRDLAFADR